MTVNHFTIARKASDEGERLRIVAAYPLERITDDPVLAKLVSKTAALFQVPIALVSIVTDDQQCFPACVGLDVSSTTRSISFCGHAILGNEAMIVPDAHLDPRFAGNPLVIGPPHVRFYAGARLLSPEGVAIGTLCVIDTVPRPVETFDLPRLETQAEAVMYRLGKLREQWS